MGKGTILGGGTGGQYSLEVKLDTSRIQAEIARLNGRIAQVQSLMAGMEEGKRKSYYRLLLTSLWKKKAYLENYTPENPVLSAWCADLTENLSGDVGTIEVPGERGTVLIRPGHNGNASYSPGRDGILTPSVAMSPEATFYNLAMKPGWQKWMPTYRFGTITSLDTDNNTCSISLEGAENSDTGLGVNQSGSLSNVPISYMECNGAAFEVGDEVVIEFQGQDWNNPRVIGFRKNPKPCCVVYETYDDGEFKQSAVSVIVDYPGEIPPMEYRFEDGTLYVRIYGQRVHVICPVNAQAKDYPYLRWNVNLNGEVNADGYLNFQAVVNETRTHSWVLYDSRIGHELYWDWYFPHRPPAFTAEMSELGVKEYNIADTFGETAWISSIRMELAGNMEIGIDFMTLCPK